MTTPTEVREASKRLANALKRAGIQRTAGGYTYAAGDVPAVTLTHEHLVMQTGSVTYGNAFRVHFRHPHTGALYNIPGLPDFVGMTRRDARRTIDAYVDAIHATMDAVEQRNTAPAYADALHDAANTLAACDNGGTAGSPAKVREALRSLITAVEARA